MSDEMDSNVKVHTDDRDVSEAVTYPCDEINVCYTPSESGFLMVALMFSMNGGTRAAFPIHLDVAEAVHAKLGDTIEYLKKQRGDRSSHNPENHTIN